MMEKKEYESIKKKILKIYNLAEHGVGGEAINARNLLNQWLAKYGLSLETILEEENEKHWYLFKGAGLLHHRKLLFNCYAKVTNRSEVTYRHKRGGTKIWLELTAYEYAELTAMFEWHKVRLERELKKLKDEATSAFIQKYELFPKDDQDDSPRAPLTPAEKARLLRVIALMRGMEKEPFLKALMDHKE